MYSIENVVSEEKAKDTVGEQKKMTFFFKKQMKIVKLERNIRQTVGRFGHFMRRNTLENIDIDSRNILGILRGEAHLKT